MAKVEVFLKEGQTSRLRSQGQNIFCNGKVLSQGNVHMKYESPTSSG